jgi:hypothetical protein
MQIQPFIPGLSDYRGFAVAAISENIEDGDFAKFAIGYLPRTMSYDQYVGVAAIATSQHTDRDKQSQIYTMFH